MNQTRLDKLMEMERQKPNDAFIKFAIGQEHVSSQNDLRAKEYFDTLLSAYPQYLPTYYQAGKLYERLNDLNGAINIYTQGITLAKSLNDMKTAGELQEALTLLEDE